MPYDGDVNRLLDPDVCYGDRKSQFSNALDPRWNISLHTNIGMGNVGPRVFYLTRGSITFTHLDATIGMTRDGVGLLLPNTTSGLGGDTPTYWPNLTRGSMLITFRATQASDTPATGIPFVFTNLAGGEWEIHISRFSGIYHFGWYNNGTDTRATCTAASRWNVGDLVTIGFDYSPTGTRGYINGIQVANNTTPPSTFDKRGVGSSLGLGYFGASQNTGWQNPILTWTILDRELTTQEWEYIQRNPLSWMYSPSPIGLLLDLPLSSGILQTAVSMM